MHEGLVYELHNACVSAAQSQQAHSQIRTLLLQSVIKDVLVKSSNTLFT